MTKMMIRIIFFLIALIMVVGASYLMHSKLGVFNFAQGSDSDLNIVSAPLWLTAAISAGLLLFIAFLTWYSRVGVLHLILLAVLMFAWIINGRVVGVSTDGRILAGWFYVRTEFVNFREPDEDPEVYVSHMKILAHSRWQLEIQIREHRAKIFVGPILRNSLLGALKERGFKVIE